jgi:tetratricopeptide (TPR) repeat protein
MRFLHWWFTSRRVLIPLMIVADLLALWVWGSRPPRVYSDWLGLVGRPEEAPIVRLRNWAVEQSAPLSPSGVVSLFETEELVVVGMLMFILLFLVVLLTVSRSGKSWRFLSASQVRLLRLLPVRFRVRTALIAIAILGLYLGWEIETRKTWRMRESRLKNAWAAANKETSRRNSLHSLQVELAKLKTPLTDLSDPEHGYYRSKAALAADRELERDRLDREISDLSPIVDAYAERRRTYERAVTNPRAAVSPDLPIPEPTREGSAWRAAQRWLYKHDYGRALATLDEVIRSFPDFVEAHECTSGIRASCPDARFRDGELAITSATRACELTNWKDIEALSLLAAAYAETGDFAEAVEWQQKVVIMTVNHSDASNHRDRMALYKSGKPYRVN